MGISKAAAWGTAGILAAGVTGGLTYAAVSTPAGAAGTGTTPGASTATSTPVERAPGRAALLRRLEHGRLTIRTKQGDRTLDVQRGQVKRVSPTSISVTSPDGFAGTYAVTSSTRVRGSSGRASISAVHAGDTVFVVATAGKALRIVDPGPKAGAGG